MDDNSTITATVVTICIALGWIAFNVTQCTINRDNMEAKYPHHYTAAVTSTVNSSTGQTAQ